LLWPTFPVKQTIDLFATGPAYTTCNTVSILAKAEWSMGHLGK
jgi:hypothetical protein